MKTLNFKKRNELRRLKIYLANLYDPLNIFPDGYLKHHENRIDCLKWLIASYEDMAGDPKTLLESILIPIKESAFNQRDADQIRFLYYWIYYKQITGF